MRKMNRPNELIKELEEFNEDMYSYELCSSECKELTDYISKLEKENKGLRDSCELKLATALNYKREREILEKALDIATEYAEHKRTWYRVEGYSLKETLMYEARKELENDK